MSADLIAWAEGKAAAWRGRAEQERWLARHCAEASVDSDSAKHRELYLSTAARADTHANGLEQNAANLEALVALVKEKAHV